MKGRGIDPPHGVAHAPHSVMSISHPHGTVRRDVLTGAELSASEARRETSLFKSQGAAQAAGALGGMIMGGTMGLVFHGPIAAVVYAAVSAVICTFFANAVTGKESQLPLPAHALARIDANDRC